jgi:uncharacterized membrane protein
MATVIIMSITAGVLGALGALIGKLSLSADSPFIKHITEICREYYNWNLINTIIESTIEIKCNYSLPYFFRVLGFSLMIYCNALMLTLFLKALEKGSTIEVVVLNSAANFITTGIFGKLVFREIVTTKWILGLILISLGMTLVSIAGQEKGSVKSEKTIKN